MSGIAEFLSRKGYKVTGSELYPSQITERLEKLGIKIFKGHNADNINKDTDLVVYSSAIKEDNAEYAKAKESGIKIIKRAVMLGELVNDLFLISVSGTHGKTSTTALIAKLLIDNGFDPVVFVGGTVDFLDGGSSRIGNGKYAVVEADEYDRSFLTLKSDIAVITNIELDHTDIYSDLAELKESFQQFLYNAKKECKIVACGDSDNVMDILQKVDRNEKLLYGLNNTNDYTLEDIESINGNISYNFDNQKIVLNIPGVHNALNASAAYLAGKLTGMKAENIKDSLFRFNGVKRRLELKYNSDISIYDDYAHHPTEIIASYKAIRNIAKGRIITVFQPHTYTRTRDLYNEFAYALKENDVLILTEIYAAREKAIDNVSSELILNRLMDFNKGNIYYLKTFEEIEKILKGIIKKDDTIIFQGAGSITELCDMFVKNYPEGKK